MASLPATADETTEASRRWRERSVDQKRRPTRCNDDTGTASAMHRAEYRSLPDVLSAEAKASASEERNEGRLVRQARRVVVQLLGHSEPRVERAAFWRSSGGELSPEARGAKQCVISAV